MSENSYGQEVRDLSERRKMGKALRKTTPRSSHGQWQPAAERPQQDRSSISADATGGFRRRRRRRRSREFVPSSDLVAGDG